MSTARDKALKALERHSHIHGIKENTGKVGYSGTESEKLEKEALLLDEKLQKLEKSEKESINLALEDMVAFKRNGESTITIMDATIAAKEYMGDRGPAGANGLRGLHGKDGQPGIHGVDGLQGQVGMAGPEGKAGSSLLSGYEDPTGSIGKDGDHYFNDATDTIFGPKAGGKWPRGVCLVGAQGADGAQGLSIQGPQGEQGLIGDDGTNILPLDNTWTGLNTFTGGLKSEGAGDNTVRIGTDAGLTSQSTTAIAIGKEAGKTSQNSGALAIGNNAGLSNQGQKSFALGLQAGKTNQGEYSIAIGNSAGKTNQGDKGVIISANNVALEDATDSHIHIATDEASINYTSAAGFSVTSTVTASNKFTASAIKSSTYNVDYAGFDCGTVGGYYGLRLYSMNGDYIWGANTAPASTAMQLGSTTGNLTLLGTCTATSFVGSGSALTGLLNLADLKALVAASADFADFQTRIAAL